jgi:glutamine synthetase
MTPREILAFIREKEVRAVDLRFMDFPGQWQHFTIPAENLDEATFEEGLGFDGSSIRGWKSDRMPPTCWPSPTRPPPSSTPSAARRRSRSSATSTIR